MYKEFLSLNPFSNQTASSDSAAHPQTCPEPSADYWSERAQHIFLRAPVLPKAAQPRLHLVGAPCPRTPQCQHLSFCFCFLQPTEPAPLPQQASLWPLALHTEGPGLPAAPAASPPGKVTSQVFTREMGGGLRREGTYVYLQLICVDMWQRPIQYCRAAVLQ